MREIADNPGRRRFEAHEDGALAGFAAYDLRPDRIVFMHTEVDPRFEGTGVGSDLARFALDAARADTERAVVVRCPFMVAWIERHPEYADLLTRRPS